MSATIAQLGARVLRKLGISIVADASRPADGATMTSAAVAARVLLELGIPVAEADRPAPLPPVSQAELAARTLRAVGVNPAAAGSDTFSGVIYTVAQLANATLLKLAVIASDELPAALDQVEAEKRVNAVHDILVGLRYVSWPITAIPATVADYYVIMAVNLLAPQFGKPASAEAFAAGQMGIRMQALSGPFGQTLAEAKVAEVHDAISAQGLASWPLTAVPEAQAEAYIELAAVLLAPVMHAGQDAQPEAAQQASWDAAMVRLRKAAVIAGAQARAQAKVQAVQSELNALGSVTWGPEAIPAAVGDAMASMAALQMGSEFGKEFDPKLYDFNMDRVRRISMGGPIGQALANQKIQSVHYSLDARGRTRWTLFDLPEWAEENYVLMAATLLAPEVGAKADPSWWPMAEMDLIRIVSLSSQREPVIAMYY